MDGVVTGAQASAVSTTQLQTRMIYKWRHVQTKGCLFHKLLNGKITCLVREMFLTFSLRTKIPPRDTVASIIAT